MPEILSMITFIPTRVLAKCKPCNGFINEKNGKMTLCSGTFQDDSVGASLEKEWGTLSVTGKKNRPVLIKTTINKIETDYLIDQRYSNTLSKESYSATKDTDHDGKIDAGEPSVNIIVEHGVLSKKNIKNVTFMK